MVCVILFQGGIRVDPRTLLREFAYTILSDPTHMSQYHIFSTLHELAEKAVEMYGFDIKETIDLETFEDYMEDYKKDYPILSKEE